METNMIQHASAHIPLSHLRDPWLPYRKERAKVRIRLLCFPFAGGGASSYIPWNSILPPEVEVCAVQLPGRERRLAEPAAQRMDALVDQLLVKLIPLFDVPFALFGHSMGATIAFELARRLLCEHSIEPAHLFASSRPAPHYPRGRRIIHQLSDVELVNFVRRIGGDPTGLLEIPDARTKMLDTLRADLALTETYIPPDGAVLACPITAFGGADEPLFRADYLESWRHCTTGAFDSRVLEGDHFFFLPNPKPLISAIVERLSADRQ